MRFTESLKEGLEKVHTKLKEAPVKRFENKMRKIDASVQRAHDRAAMMEKKTKATRELNEARNNAKLSKIKIQEDRARSIIDKANARNAVKKAKVDRVVSNRETKYRNDIENAKSKVTKKLQSAVIDVIDGKPVNAEMLKYAKGSPAYRAMLKVKQGFTIGKENRELAKIRAEMMSTNPLKREVAIKKFARHVESSKLMAREKIKDYSAKRERKARLGEAAIKYGSMMGSATAISGALGSLYGGEDDE